MATIQGVDSSYDLLTAPKAACLGRDGVRIYVQALTALPATGLHQPGNRIASLRNAHEGGLQTAGYLLIGPGMTGRQAVAEARRNIPMDVWNRLKFVAVDVEVNGIDVTEVLSALNEVVRLGRTAVVYTSWNSWNTMIRPRNSTLISERGFFLWNAKWDGNPSIDFTRLEFGGWKRWTLIGEQWAGGHQECGQAVDSNTFERFVLLPQNLQLPPPLIPEPVLNKALIWDGRYWFAEVGVGAAAHHWWIRTEAERSARYEHWARFNRNPRGSRLDFA